MNELSPNLNLPFIVSSQAQKHITHNEALQMLDTVVQLCALDRNLSAPPAVNSDGDRYIVGASATGDWLGKELQIATWQNSTWIFQNPVIGWVCWVLDEQSLLVWNGSTWTPVTTESNVNPTPLVGVNATADSTTRLSVSSQITLFNHEGADHFMKINKASDTDAASLLFQTGFSGRAEMGLIGDDDFHFKISADGATWKEAITINKATGEASFPFTSFPGGAAKNFILNGTMSINQREFAGGALLAGKYGFDRWKADTGGCNHSLSGNTLTLTSGTLVQTIESPDLAGQSITFSIEDLAGGDLDIDVEGETGTITPGVGRRGVSITVPGGSLGNITLKLTPAAGAITFKRAQLEKGTVFTDIPERPHSFEEMLCRRYCLVLKPATALGAGNGFMPNTTTARVMIPTATQMHAIPTVAIDTTKTRIYQNNSAKGVSAISALGMMANGVTLDCTITSAGASFAAAALILLSGGTLTLEAEL